MSPLPFAAADAARIELEAAEWIARRYAGLSPEEQHEFQRWRAVDPRHHATFTELEETWRALDRVRAPGEKRFGSDPDILAPRRPRWARRFAPAFAAAAAVVLAGAVWWRTASPDRASYASAVATAVGEFQQIELPDGSTLRVNTDTRLEIAYSASERRVRLTLGEAFFTVAKSHARPFFVEANGVAVRAVGTAFNVRLHAQTVEVLVTEGRVRVADSARGESLIVARSAERSAGEPPLLVAGERAVVAAPSTAGEARSPVVADRVAAPDLARVLAWQERRLEFVAAPLAEIVAEFNRYNRMQLIVEGAGLAAERFGGSFRADQPDTLVRLLETRFGLRAERRGNETILRAGVPGTP